MLIQFLKRILSVIPTLIGISFISFFIIRMIPGDPVMLMLGERGADPAVYAEMKHNLGLDLPVYEQYYNYLKQVLQGDLGNSIISKRQIVNHIHEDMNLNKLLYKFIKKIYLKYNQHSIFVSKYIKSVTPNPNNSIVVYNNIKDHTLKSKIEIDKRDYILMISSLKLFKGIDTFISLAKESPENNFVLVLSSELEQIDSFLKKNQLYISKNLKIFPIQKKIDYFYSKAYITLVLTKPNEWIETFGLTILESFSPSSPPCAAAACS